MTLQEAQECLAQFEAKIAEAEESLAQLKRSRDSWREQVHESQRSFGLRREHR